MKSDEQLLKECLVQTFRARGSGGQHVNRTDSAVRLKHLETGITVSCQKERSQYLNKRECLRKLRAKMAALSYRPPERIPTKKPKRFKEQILKEKTKHSQKKAWRKKPQTSEES
jgi:protein subunit release factor A